MKYIADPIRPSQDELEEISSKVNEYMNSIMVKSQSEMMRLTEVHRNIGSPYRQSCGPGRYRPILEADLKLLTQKRERLYRLSKLDDEFGDKLFRDETACFLDNLD